MHRKVPRFATITNLRAPLIALLVSLSLHGIVMVTAPQALAQQSPVQQVQTVPTPAFMPTSWQPAIHFNAAPNWINDPNGPIFLDGQYHLFFQYNPFGDQWGHMSWGHAVSTDLTHWKQLPVALPEEKGTMIFSGSTVEDRDNTSGLCADAAQKTPDAALKTPHCLVAIYTGASTDRQNQNLAVSRDSGTTWTKFAGNPVIDPGLKDFRDPKVFRHAPTASWVMVVSLPTDHKVRIYRSKDLKKWEQASEFGPAGAVSGVWECPDLFELPVRDANGKRLQKADGSRWVLNVNINPGGPAGGSADQYFVGQFDGFRFTEDHAGSGPHWADRGKDFYASTSFANTGPDQNYFPDHLWIGWMSNWQYAAALPSLPGRGEMSVVRTISLRQAPAYPRLTASQEPLTLIQHPLLLVPAHKADTAWFGNAPFLPVDEANAHLTAAKLEGSAYLLRLMLEPGEAAECGIRLRRSTTDANAAATEETVVGIDFTTGRIFVDRSHSGQTDFGPNFTGRVSVPLRHPQAAQIPFEIVVDHNSIEVFAEDGETVFTSLIFPAAASRGLAFYASPTPPGAAPARIREVEFFPLD
jgi:fructan beta-fructosidase